METPSWGQTVPRGAGKEQDRAELGGPGGGGGGRRGRGGGSLQTMGQPGLQDTPLGGSTGLLLSTRRKGQISEKLIVQDRGSGAALLTWRGTEFHFLKRGRYEDGGNFERKPRALPEGSHGLF